MRKFILPVAVAMSLWFASSAQAVTYSYCGSSLRGGGTLAPDNDIKNEWDRLERVKNVNITSSYDTGWWGGDGASSVGAHWIFWRENGSYITEDFFCGGSGTSYHDGPLNQV